MRRRFTMLIVMAAMIVVLIPYSVLEKTVQ